MTLSSAAARRRRGVLLSDGGDGGGRHFRARRSRREDRHGAPPRRSTDHHYLRACCRFRRVCVGYYASWALRLGLTESKRLERAAGLPEGLDEAAAARRARAAAGGGTGRPPDAGRVRHLHLLRGGLRRPAAECAEERVILVGLGRRGPGRVSSWSSAVPPTCTLRMARAWRERAHLLPQRCSGRRRGAAAAAAAAGSASVRSPPRCAPPHAPAAPEHPPGCHWRHRRHGCGNRRECRERAAARAAAARARRPGGRGRGRSAGGRDRRLDIPRRPCGHGRRRRGCGAGAARAPAPTRGAGAGAGGGAVTGAGAGAASCRRRVRLRPLSQPRRRGWRRRRRHRAPRSGLLVCTRAPRPPPKGTCPCARGGLVPGAVLRHPAYDALVGEVRRSPSASVTRCSGGHRRCMNAGAAGSHSVARRRGHGGGAAAAAAPVLLGGSTAPPPRL